jgi:hypothetical protein
MFWVVLGLIVLFAVVSREALITAAAIGVAVWMALGVHTEVPFRSEELRKSFNNVYDYVKDVDASLTRKER